MLWLCFKLPSCLFGNTRNTSVMHEKAKLVCFIYMQPQKVKFKSVQIYMKQVSYSKTYLEMPLSKDQLPLNAGQKICRILQGEHSAILSTCVKLPIVIKFFVLSIFEWLFYTGFTVPFFSS